MAIKIGEVEALFRYPVKSMGGERLDACDLGWHGLVGDRRLAFRRIDDRGGFRPNLLISSLRSVPFEEDEWVGGVISFGENSEAAAISITLSDERCSMVNFDPVSARSDAAVLKAIVRERDNKLGVYGTVIRCGRITAGQPIFFEPAGEPLNTSF